jgi:hypothetical protein
MLRSRPQEQDWDQGHGVFAIEASEFTLPVAWTSDEADFTDE